MSSVSFEKKLLESHAEMVEKAIQEIGREHIEIRVLSEINELLTEKEKDLPSFLGKVLSKVCELIGTDTGSIALVREKEGERWLYVEDEQRNAAGRQIEGMEKENHPSSPGRSRGPRIGRTAPSPAWSPSPANPIFSPMWRRRSEKGGSSERSLRVSRSELAVPVLVDDEVIAVINVDSFRKSFFTEEHKRIIEIIARLVGRHIQDLQKNRRAAAGGGSAQAGHHLPRPQSLLLSPGDDYREQSQIPRDHSPHQHLRSLSCIIGSPSGKKGRLPESPLGLPSILITGETGSGKEFIFNHIYSLLNELYQRDRGPGNELPVRKCNIAAYSGELTYSELFGHKKGAFTSAYSDRRGILEESDGGVVFLDEIGDADPKTQVQLLRFLDNGSFVRLGENQTRYARVLLVGCDQSGSDKR